MLEIYQGDCRELFSQIKENTVDLIVSDPPYNVYENSLVKMPFQRRKKSIQWDMYNSDFLTFSQQWIEAAIPKLKKNGSLFIFGGINYCKGNDLLALLPYLRQRLEFINLIVWHYPNGYGSRRFFSNRYELIAWFAKGRKYKFYLDNVKIPYDSDTLAQYLKDKRLNPLNVIKGKNPSNVWQINHLNGNEKKRFNHPTQKPESVIERIILATTDENDLVIDPFLGSGTTAAVCQRLHRNCIGFEINPKYIYIIKDRCKIKSLDVQNLNWVQLGEKS